MAEAAKPIKFETARFITPESFKELEDSQVPRMYPCGCKSFQGVDSRFRVLCGAHKQEAIEKRNIFTRK
jgi:hypothetical protein